MERLKKIGKLKSFSASQVLNSRLGIGFEKLDRALFDPEKAYDQVASIGVKWVRLQSGWARTEKEKGIYDFAWLDSVVDNLIRRGMKPWFCLCYGNGLYSDVAKEYFYAAGCPPIHSEEERTAWRNYVSATAEHFKGRVSLYEVWNEPDSDGLWRPNGASGREYADFLADTASAIRTADPEAKIAGGALAGCVRVEGHIDWLKEMLDGGCDKVMDYFTYHVYTKDDYKVLAWNRFLSAYLKQRNPAIRLIQGEGGAQSKSTGHGAFYGRAFTPEKQAKYLTRHLILDLSTQVEFASYFSTVDMVEALSGKTGDKSTYMDYGYFGVLAADFDEDGFSTGNYTPKPSYYALQNLASLFREETTPCELPLHICGTECFRNMDVEPHEKDMMVRCFRKPNGSSACAYWKMSQIFTETYDGTITLYTADLPEDLHLVDTITGNVYELAPEMLEKRPSGILKLEHLPCRDYPLLLTFGNFADFE